ncbi:putative siderophore iron transporter mirb protein [Ilyonectria robusta]
MAWLCPLKLNQQYTIPNIVFNSGDLPGTWLRDLQLKTGIVIPSRYPLRAATNAQFYEVILSDGMIRSSCIPRDERRPTQATNRLYSEDLFNMADKIAPRTDGVEPVPFEMEEPIKEPIEKVQHGVQLAEAVTLSWTKRSLIVMYICMWLLYFVNALQNNLTSNLSAYITSDFSEHSLLTVISTMTSIMTAACTMPIAKVLNIWDRTVGFTFMMVVAIIGLIVMASCHNITTYCAAQVMYSVGFTGLIFTVDVITSDTSSLRNRGLAFAFTASPNIITAFAGSPLSQQFHESNWRWAYGTVSILLPVVATPLLVTWWLAKQKALKNHVIEDTTPTRTWMESFKYYFVEFDGFSLLLLPLTLAASQGNKWKTD